MSGEVNLYHHISIANGMNFMFGIFIAFYREKQQ